MGKTFASEVSHVCKDHRYRKAYGRKSAALCEPSRRDWSLLNDIVRFEGSKILSAGMGAIGTSYVQKASAMRALCYGVRRTVHDKPDLVEKLVTQAEMDVVALSLPGTAEAEGMFDERRLRLMLQWQPARHWARRWHNGYCRIKQEPPERR